MKSRPKNEEELEARPLEMVEFMTQRMETNITKSFLCCRSRQSQYARFEEVSELTNFHVYGFSGSSSVKDRIILSLVAVGSRVAVGLRISLPDNEESLPLPAFSMLNRLLMSVWFSSVILEFAV